MASSRISLDTAALRSSAAQVKGIAGNLENELHSLEQIIASTADAWEGAAKETFEEAFNTKYKKYLTDIITSLGNYASAMTAYANEEEETVSRGAQRFNSL